ncbi:MAG: hypothetical protein WBV82_03550 [Myxococcaceae bacterium]
MRLGELLLQENLVSREGLEEALEEQVVQGGRLGTNLVELGLISEHELARSLGKLHNMSFAAGDMKPDPRAVELLDLNFQDDRDVLAMRADATRLTVACINPRDLATLDEIAFHTGRRVVPVVICEFRMNQLLRHHCKAFRPIRAVDMNTVRPSRTKAAQQPGEVVQPMADLMSEDEFQSLYAEVLSGGRTRDQEEILEGTIVEEEPTPPAPVIAPPAAPPPAPAPRPLSFSEAQKALGQSSDREQVAQTVLRFAISKWKRALLLNVQGALVTGWRGAGQGIRDGAVARIAVALRGQTTFKLVRDTRSHFVGPLRRDAGTAIFFRLLGGDFPTNAVMMPLLVRGKVVHILYVDNGPGQVTPPDIGELLILAQSVARSYEAIIKARQKA